MADNIMTDNIMTDKTGKNIYAFAGSFNPPHIGHMLAVRQMLDMGADRIHIFVRSNKKLDLADAATKERWFNTMKEEYASTGWDKVVIHMVESKKVTGKSYSLKIVRDAIKQLDTEAGEHITHYYAGDDYKKFRPFWRFITKETRLVIGARTEGISSTAIRNNLEGNRFLLPPYIYEDLKKIAENRK